MRKTTKPVKIKDLAVKGPWTFELVFRGLDDEALMAKLENRRGNGRHDYPIRVMWNLILAMKVFQHTVPLNRFAKN